MRLVALEWLDSSSPGRWATASAIGDECAIIRSIGWVISENDESVTIASHVSQEKDPECDGVMTIPKCCIVKRRRVTSPWKAR